MIEEATLMEKSVYEKANESAAYIMSKIQASLTAEATDKLPGMTTSKTTDVPRIAIVLGSGLGHFAEELTDKVVIPYSEIPHYRKTTTPGHKGRLILGKLSGIGRAHV